MGLGKPIYGTDLSKPMSVLIEDIRGQISQARGQLSDIAYAKSAWKQQLDEVQGLLTCGLVVLHGIKETAAEHEKARHEDKVA